MFYAYSPYGEATALGPDGGNSLQYTGRENDGTGLYYYRARYYDPVLKRFVSEDPIALQAGPNFYGYVDANPASGSDPSGLFTGTVGGSLRIPGWLQWVIPGFIGQGGNAGFAIQLTDTCGNFLPDFGFYWGGSAGGGDFGIGRGAINFGGHTGTIQDLAGSGHDVSAHWGLGGVTGYWNDKGQYTGASFDLGLGYNVGIAGSIGGSWSIGRGLSR